MEELQILHEMTRFQSNRLFIFKDYVDLFKNSV